MKEALRQLERSTAANKDMKQRMMKDRIAIIERFVGARESLAAGDAHTMVTVCN